MAELRSRGHHAPRPRAEPDDAGEVLGTAARSAARWRLPALMPAYGWGVAAAVALAAPFVAFNTLEVQLPNGRVRVAGIDGWGRDHPHGALLFHGHDIRFGLLLWACALALAAAAALVVVAMRAADDLVLRRRAMVAAIAAPSMLAGVVASVLLSAQTYVDRMNALSAGREPSLTAGEAVYVAGYGGGVWLCMAALVVAVLSSYLFLRRLLPEPVGDGPRLDPSGP